jgi:signal transduction histidine kinase
MSQLGSIAVQLALPAAAAVATAAIAAAVALARRLRSLAGELARLRSLERRHEVEIAAAHKELENFLYAVSHDLRAPLRSIDGFSLALLEDYDAKLDDEGRDCLRRVRDAAQNMGVLIEDLLQLSRATRGEMNIEPVDLSALAESALQRLRASAPGREVTAAIEPGVTGYGDARLLQTLMDNLLSNAWKFTGRTGHALIEFGGERRDGELLCRVHDNGAGFDMAYADKLFAPFQRLHSPTQYPGTGIGLATVKRIVARHGGRVWAEAAKDRGATFHFTLPAAATA